MERVVSVNLNGRAYQLEERAYEALKSYLDSARATLAGNPDQTEIIADLEQAIADKCAGYMNAHKQVVTGAEMATILEEMGPVHGADEGEARAAAEPRASSSSSGGGARKRLYRIKEGAWISGVSTGMAAYFDIDVSIIRILWVVAAIFTNLLAVIAYIVMMFVIPSANTSEEWAAAHGVPFNAQGVIDEAKKRYAEWQDRSGGFRRWTDDMSQKFDGMSARAARRAERREARRWRRQRAYAAAAATRPPVGYLTQIIAGIVAIVFGIVSAALTIAFLVAIFSLVTTGAILGYVPLISAPIWLVIIVLAIIYAAVALPLRAIRQASYRALSGDARGDDPWDGLLTLLLVALFVWLAWRFIPEAHTAINDIISWFNTVFIAEIR